MIKFELEANEAAFIVQAIGSLPTQSNAYPLWVRLSQQLNAQQAKEETPPAPNSN
jgi:hypothetical protein